MEDPDVIVIGGGTSGCVVASRLSEDPTIRVLLIEAGPDFPTQADKPLALRSTNATLPGEELLWTYPVRLGTAPAPAQQVRGRVLGGSSAVNGALFLRGLASDYDSWDVDGWRYADVLPAFVKLESDQDFTAGYHGRSGPVQVRRTPEAHWSPFAVACAEAFAAEGHAYKPDVNAPTGAGYGALPYTSRSGNRVSASDAYLTDEVRSRPNLDIRCGAVAQKLLFDQHRCVGVMFTTDAETHEVHADEIVLACGVFESPRLLLRSGLGPARHLTRRDIRVVADRPGVGANLHCHPGVRISFPTRSLPPSSPGTAAFHLGLLFGEEKGRGDDMAVLVRQVGEAIGLNLTVRLPRSRGSLCLSAGQAGTLTVDYGYLDDADVRRLISALPWLVDMLTSMNLTGDLEATTPDLLAATQSSDEGRMADWVRAHLVTALHGCGTCAIGAESDPAAVVDPKLRVIGTTGLRVADASVLPSSVRGGPYAASLMIGERAAQLIAAS